MISVNYLTYRAYKTVKATLKMFQANESEKDKSMIKKKGAIFRMLQSSTLLSALLLVELSLTVVIMIDVSYFDPMMQMVQIMCNLLYLIFVLHFYNGYFSAKIKDKMARS